MTKDISDLESDIYYQRSYSALYEGNAKYFDFLYEEGSKYIKFSALKRRIDSVAGTMINEELYDLETPYGYGGPISNCTDERFLNRAFYEYRNYCKENKIVCEFIRFHPFNILAESDMFFDMHSSERQVVVVDLDVSTEERRSHYSKTTRNIVKKAEKSLMVERSKVSLADFISMYYQTMEKNTADDFFYFDENYFKSLMNIDGVSLLATKKKDVYASIGFFMCGSELAHYHLSANNQDLAKENANYLLLDAAFEHAKSRGCSYMMLGGGRSSSPEDSLFKFKAKFSPYTKTFFIAGLDFLPEKRKMLNQLWIENKSESTIPKLFQLYRA